MTEDNLFWWVASILVGAGSVPAGLVLVLFLEYVKKMLRPSNGLEVIHFPSAPAATEFMPLISGLARNGIPFKGSELWIWGCDGRYIINNRGKRWRRVFRKWQRKGLVIRYLLPEDVDDVVRGEMGNLNIGANFEVRQLKRCDETRNIARKLETYHPTLFFGADGNNAAWIEGLHRRNSIYAYNVDYVPPRVIESSPEERKRFKSCEEDLRFIYENSTRLVLS